MVVMIAVRPGQIIFLNGTTSAGKTSIGEQLQLMLEKPYFHLSVDRISGMRAELRTSQLSPNELDAVLARTRAGFHRVVAGMAQAGNDVIVDHVLSEPWRLRDCLTVLAGYDVIFVGVHCSLPELERREHVRGTRPIGLAASQFAAVHSHGVYDIECHTEVFTPRECALQVTEYLMNPAQPSAFHRLRVIMGS